MGSGHSSNARQASWRWPTLRHTSPRQRTWKETLKKSFVRMRLFSEASIFVFNNCECPTTVSTSATCLAHLLVLYFAWQGQQEPGTQTGDEYSKSMFRDDNGTKRDGRKRYPSPLRRTRGTATTVLSSTLSPPPLSKTCPLCPGQEEFRQRTPRRSAALSSAPPLRPSTLDPAACRPTRRDNGGSHLRWGQPHRARKGSS